MIEDEDIPRCQNLDGSTLTIRPDLSEGPNRVAITDGERTAIFVPVATPPTSETRTYAERLEGAPARIVPSYIEGGWFCEAQCVTLTDGAGEVLFVPESPIHLSDPSAHARDGRTKLSPAP